MNRGRHKKQNYDAIIDRHKYKRLSNLTFTEMSNLLKEFGIQLCIELKNNKPNTKKI